MKQRATMMDMIKQAYEEKVEINLTLYEDDNKYKKHNKDMMDFLDMFFADEDNIGFTITNKDKGSIQITIGHDGVKHMYNVIQSISEVK